MLFSAVAKRALVGKHDFQVSIGAYWPDEIGCDGRWAVSTEGQVDAEMRRQPSPHLREGDRVGMLPILDSLRLIVGGRSNFGLALRLDRQAEDRSLGRDAPAGTEAGVNAPER